MSTNQLPPPPPFSPPQTTPRKRRPWTRYAIGAAVGTIIVVVLIVVGLFTVSFVQGLGENGAANPAPSLSIAPVDTEPPAPSPTTEPAEEPAATASTATPTTAETTPRDSFADLAAQADDVLGPLEMSDGTRFAVLADVGEPIALSTGFVRLAVEGPSGWEVRDEISMDGSPMKLSTPDDVDGDGVPEIQVDWFAGANTDFGLLYRLEADGPRLAEIPFAVEQLGEPMYDYLITSVGPGAVTTSVENCDPSCADGGMHDVSWSYDPEERRLIPIDAGSSRAAQFIVTTGTANDGASFISADCPAGEFNGHEAIVYECTAATQDGRNHDVAVSEQAETGSLFIVDAISAESAACDSYSYQDDLPLQLCDQGLAVSWLKTALTDRGYDVGSEDELFDFNTQSAVFAFQSDNGLDNDGIVGPATWETLGGGAGLPGWDLNGDGMITPEEIVYD